MSSMPDIACSLCEGSEDLDLIQHVCTDCVEVLEWCTDPEYWHELEDYSEND